MTQPLQSLPIEVIRALRDCHLPVLAEFVRCGRNLTPIGAQRLAAAIRTATGDTQEQVFAAFNGETGHNDYVRVNRGSLAFSFICQMKS